jgi:mannose-6-phosphate isomerase-like protein (cupin superfamily)
VGLVESEEAGVVQLGPVAIRYVHSGGLGSYSLLEWFAPAGTPSPPIHIHHETDEGFYVIEGSYGFLLDDRRLEARSGGHVLVPRGRPHTFWNAGREAARCLIVLSPPGFEGYFRELADGLAHAATEEAAMQLRHQLSTRYDIEVVGPPVDVG